jgi:hypothetical protein
MSRGLLVCAGLLSLLGCDETRVKTLKSELSVRYLAGCAPDRVERMTLEALGDFPVAPDAVQSFDATHGAARLRSLPVDAELYRLRVTSTLASGGVFSGVAISPVADQGQDFPALVLPLGAHCKVSGSLPALEQAMFVSLAGGDLLLAGGLQAATGKLALRDSYRVAAESGQVTRDADGMFLPRVLATALRVGNESWIFGGAQSALNGSPGLDSFERYDTLAGKFSTLGRLLAARVRPAAALLSDGNVLLAGGESSVSGRALDSLERISPATGASTMLDVSMPWPARQLQLAVRDDGLVWFAADRAGELALALFDPRALAFQTHDAPAAELGESLLVALPGARAALIEVKQGATTGVLYVLLPDGSLARVADWLTSFAGLSAPLAQALPDGRILLTGTRAGEARARTIDVGRHEVLAQSLDAPLLALAARDDGSVAELAARALLLVREDDHTPYDNPGGTLLGDDADAVTLDLAAHWQRDGLELISVAADARFELAGLRYRDVRIEVDLTGPGELQLRREDGESRSLSLADEQAGPAFCTASRKTGGPIVLERKGDHVHIETSDARRTCLLDGIDGPITLSFRALSKDVRVRSLIVTRLGTSSDP